jgi:hypothetical protein
MKHIFISYSRNDKDFANQLASDLENRDYQIWIDTADIRAGEKWSTAVQQGLKLGSIMLVIVSPSSIKSRNVEDEWQFYLDQQKSIIPILLEPTSELHFQLNRIQRIDFHDQDYETAFDQLCSELQSKTAQTTNGDTRQIIQDLTTEPAFMLPMLEWCEVDGGAVVIDYGNGNTQIFDVKPFRISRFPVTNAQFQSFVTVQHGYSNNKRWWDYSPQHGLEWHRVHAEPAKSPFLGQDMPRVNVCWYEAVAFCNWLSYKMNFKVSLPTEQQWQRAGQGDDNRLYPWGDSFSEIRCNTKESQIGGVTPVDRYPNGKSPFGVFDLSGNIWEFCSTNHRNGSNGDFESKDPRVLRGGPWDGDQNNAKLTSRNHADPDHLGQNIGFRLITTI